MTNNCDDSPYIISTMATTSLTQVLGKGLQSEAGICSGGGGQKRRVVGLILMDIDVGGGDVDDDGVEEGKSPSALKQNRKMQI